MGSRADRRSAAPISCPVSCLSRITHHARAAFPPAEPAQPPQCPARHAICHATRNTQHEPARPPPQQHPHAPRPTGPQPYRPPARKRLARHRPALWPWRSPIICAPRAIPALTWSNPARRWTTPSAPACRPPVPPSWPTFPTRLISFALPRPVAQQLQADPRTQAVLPYEPYFKLKPPLLALAVEQQPLPENSTLNVLLFPDARAAALDELNNLGVQVLGEERSPFGPVLKVQTGSAGILQPPSPGLASVQAVELSQRPRAGQRPEPRAHCRRRQHGHHQQLPRPDRQQCARQRQ